ncbi:MAG: HNH endonuclease [Chloroflexota bacterium]|nr:HNH endonuclease [Chloroflexota bacterium]MDE2959268.1 HNH endonuclease [Chloroflexota bacterium]
MNSRNNPPASPHERPFSTTAEKYNAEYASGKVTGSNFPHHEVRSLPGYVERNTPGLTGSDVTKELARHLTEYAERHGCPLPYEQRDIAFYLWLQASRSMLAWDEIFNVVRATRKRYGLQPIAHYFGYRSIIMRKAGRARDRKLIKLIRYISQEGECNGCRLEFPFNDLTLDRIRPGKANGAYNLANVQLMCQPCNNDKGDSYVQ